MAATIYYDNDADPSVLRDRPIAILGKSIYIYEFNPP